MRKLILISAFVLAAASVQAVEARELILAASDAQAAAAPTPVAAKAAPAAPAVTADTVPPQVSRKQVSRPQQPQLRRESDEQKARRIAARYGVYW